MFQPFQTKLVLVIVVGRNDVFVIQRKTGSEKRSEKRGQATFPL